ncbi:MAG: DUF1616 domain-containing protein [Candidatus Bathyarchaeia archaeon]
MQLENHKILYITVTVTLALLIASPALQHFLVYPQSEFFTEMWLLGPNQKAENYPYNIVQNQHYQIYLGLSNHLGSATYYRVDVKLRNQTMLGPDGFQRTPSDLPTLYSFNIIVADQQTVQVPVDFSLTYHQFNDSQINFNQLTINSNTININGYTTSWNNTNHDYYEKLVFELYLYNSTTNSFQYHERFVDLRLNMTAPA